MCMPESGFNIARRCLFSTDEIHRGLLHPKVSNASWAIIAHFSVQPPMVISKLLTTGDSSEDEIESRMTYQNIRPRLWSVSHRYVNNVKLVNMFNTAIC